MGFLRNDTRAGPASLQLREGAEEPRKARGILQPPCAWVSLNALQVKMCFLVEHRKEGPLGNSASHPTHFLRACN